ncbi:MAG: response regulator [Alphaproteobacteria bacterium]|nr:response regulator [Alphaproteobacteria bacterium]
MAYRILVVDDDAEIREVLKTFLEGAGYDVAMARTSDEARRFVEESALDLAIIDAVLPGESGLSLAEWASREKKLPVVLVSGDWYAFQQLKGYPYVRLSKPFRMSNLLHVVDQEIRAATRRLALDQPLIGAARPALPRAW